MEIKKKDAPWHLYIAKSIVLFRKLIHIATHHKVCLKQELTKTKELFVLLYKSTNEVLSEIERVKVRRQFVDIMKAIPVLIIIALPFTFITLPTFIYLVPRSAFPSSFQQPLPPFLG